jgi:hypothetical protein
MSRMIRDEHIRVETCQGQRPLGLQPVVQTDKKRVSGRICAHLDTISKGFHRVEQMEPKNDVLATDRPIGCKSIPSWVNILYCLSDRPSERLEAGCEINKSIKH